MVDTNDIIDALILLLRDIPDLVKALGDDETRIFAYKDEYPQSISLQQAIYDQSTPSVMLAFQARARASRGDFATYRHDILVIIRPSSVADYASIAALISEGKPESVGLEICNIDVVDDCDPFGVDLPELRRESDENGIDYYTLLLSFNEK